MRRTGPLRRAGIALFALLIAGSAFARPARPARDMYAAAQAREKALRAAWEQTGSQADRTTAAVRRELRSVVAAYETIVRRHPTSGYCDNALWQGATLAADGFAASRQDADRLLAARLFAFLAREYPTSPYAKKAADQARRLESSAPAHAPNTANDAASPDRGRNASPDRTPAPRVGEVPASSSATRGPALPALSTLRDIRRTVLPEVVRVTLELDREVAFHEERVEKPARLLFDLPGTTTKASLKDASWTYSDDIVRQIRVGRHPKQTSRVVLDLEGVSRYTIATLYNPYRILIDCERSAFALRASADKADAALRASADKAASAPPGASAPKPDAAPRASAPRPAVAAPEKTPAPSKPAVADETPTPSGPPPATRKPERPKPADGRVSMARQLGLGVSRVVIDPGHGGRDPGAEGPNGNEAAIVLDIALRVEKLLKRQPGVEVVLTRHEDVFVPLEERTEIANREQADLFLSIHANASRNEKARGIETYYLNFASNPEAEAVAARENSASERTMNSLTDIVKAIALNNKLDESKDFAGLVQQAMARRLRTSNKSLKDLGVKQAPFVVLVGAGMPSVLAEVSFVTNPREAQLLDSSTYRQRIADALTEAVLRYRRELKSANVVAHQ